jgi:hypothetical protein
MRMSDTGTKSRQASNQLFGALVGAPPMSRGDHLLHPRNLMSIEVRIGTLFPRRGVAVVKSRLSPASALGTRSRIWNARRGRIGRRRGECRAIGSLRRESVDHGGMARSRPPRHSDSSERGELPGVQETANLSEWMPPRDLVSRGTGTPLHDQAQRHRLFEAKA